MDEQVTVMRPGSKVKVNDMDGTILMSAIGVGCAISYQVAYWDKADRKTVWVEHCEVSEERGVRS